MMAIQQAGGDQIGGLHLRVNAKLRIGNGIRILCPTGKCEGRGQLQVRNP